ncbi:MAG TPA: class III extradiol ring-cleavage dioxygenase [Burkholderiales bacterium]|nr:class III extradiol ring-cleavage dioxygenase [Burkholderiales bacterium]
MILPSLFVSHGAPTLALDPGKTGAALARLAAGIARPTAILVASAHWSGSALALGASERPETIHDFGGFPEALYRIGYPAPGAPDLALRAQQLLAAHGFEAALDAGRGLDHGAWVPLRLMYPDADIPVMQISLQPRLGPEHHYRIGKALAPLRNEGVLILASGSLTHNLSELGAYDSDSPAPEWVDLFQQWVAQRVEANDIDALLRYRELAPAAIRNHPTEEHFMPLFVALGAAGGEYYAQRIDSGTTYGILAMDAYVFGDNLAV